MAVRPLTFKSDFTPPPSLSFFSSRSLAFLFLNVVTLGSYGPHQLYLKRHKIKELELQQEDLQNQAYQLIKQGEEVESDLHEIRQTLNIKSRGEGKNITSLIGTIKPLLEQASAKKDKLKNSSVFSSQEVHTTITQVALNCLKGIAEFFANFLLIGFYATYHNHFLQNRLNLLNAQQDYLVKSINKELIENKTQGMEQQLESLKENLRVQQDLEEIHHTIPANARQEAEQARQRTEQLKQDNQQLNTNYNALKVRKIELEQEITQLERRLSLINQDKSSLLTTKDILQKDLQQRRKELESLHVKISELKQDLKQAKAAAVRVADLNRQISYIAATKKHLSRLKTIDPQLGPLPSAYIPKPDDGEFRWSQMGQAKKMDDDEIAEAQLKAKEQAKRELGLESLTLQQMTTAQRLQVSNRTSEIFELARPKEVPPFLKEYFNRYNDKRTAAEVVKAGFQFAFRELSQMALQSDAKISFHDILINQDKHSSHRRAVYAFIALDWIKHAQLQKDDCHSWYLRLNNQDVTMTPSYPELVQSFHTHANSHELIPTTHTLFTHIDEFTPPLGDEELKKGTDPVGAKWAFERLNEEEKGYLFNLLMQPFVLVSHPDWSATKNFMHQGNRERAKLVEIARDLIKDLAIAIDKNFGQNVLAAQWRLQALPKKDSI